MKSWSEWRKKYKGVNRVPKKLASGKTVHYFYHRASGTRLDGEPGTAAFDDSFIAADRIAPKDTGTVAALIREYLDSPKFKKLAESTKREKRRLLAAVEAATVKGTKQTFGTMPIVALAAPRVVGKFLDYHEEIGADHPREADNRLAAIASVLSYHKKKGRIARNPIESFERLYAGDRSEIVWEERPITIFMDGAAVELQRALILGIHTGQRYSDIVLMKWTQYDGTYIRVKQRKGGAFVTVKASAALKSMLDSIPRKGEYILTRADGRPWFTEKNVKALSAAWIQRMKDCGLFFETPHLHFHDMRGTSVTLLSEAGCTIQEVVSITGHSMETANRILKKYLARTRTLSDAAIAKFEASPATAFANRLQTTPVALQAAE